MSRPMLDALSDLSVDRKYVFDGMAYAATLGGILEWLPGVVSLLAGIWWLIRIYETRTVQILLRRGNHVDVLEVCNPADGSPSVQLLERAGDD